jgi:hypothetical protein
MSTTKELVDHLEGWIALFAPDDHVNWKEHGKMFAEAADRLQSQETEIKRLREALNEIISLAHDGDAYDTGYGYDIRCVASSALAKGAA